MKHLLTAMALLAAAALHAQNIHTQGAEPYRSKIAPYGSAAEAAAGDTAQSRYIVPLNDLTRTETDGKVRFTADYVYPSAWLNRQILVRIESASTGYTVEANGKTAGYTQNGAVPVEFNLTKASQQGVNTLSIIIDTAAADPLLKTGVAWLGRVEIISQPTIRVRDIMQVTSLNDAGDGVAEFAIAVKTDALNTKQARIEYELENGAGQSFAHGFQDISLDMRREDTVRFSAIVPKEFLWTTEKPEQLKLTVRNRIEGRISEIEVIPVGLREAAYSAGILTVNRMPQSVKAKVVAPNISKDELLALKEQGYNAVTVEAGEAALSLYEACDAAGMYAIPQLAADTSAGGRSIRRGGNPSNDPELTETYADRALAMYHTSKNHPSVIAYSLGHGITNGINPYETYLLLKRLETGRPIIYDGAGKEWNNDAFDLQTVRPLR